MTTLSSSPRALPQVKGSAAFLAAVCLVASLGGFLFGFDTAVISGTFGMVETQYSLSKFQVGWFGSSALAGCILGAAVAGVLSDRFGRKPTLIASGILFFISALYSAIPPTFQVLIWARIIGGVGVGMASVVAPLYISEFSPPHLRGRLVATYQLSIVLGILAAYFSNWLLLRFAQTHPETFGGIGRLHWTLVAEPWRGMFGAEMIPAALFTLLLFVVPESPRWLAKAARPDQALALLTKISGSAIARRVCSSKPACRASIAAPARLTGSEANLRRVRKKAYRAGIIQIDTASLAISNWSAEGSAPARLFSSQPADQSQSEASGV